MNIRDDKGNQRIEQCTVLDLETTGTSAAFGDRILELAALRLENNQVTSIFHRVLDHGEDLSNGLDWNADNLIDVPRVNEKTLLDELDPWLETLPIVAHGASFERKFLNAARQRHGQLALPNRWVCTINLSKKHISTAPAFDLSNLCRHLDLPRGKPHQAMDDAKACMGLWLVLKRIELCSSKSPRMRGT